MKEAFTAEASLTISARLTQFLYRHIFLRILFSSTILPSFLQRKVVESKEFYTLEQHSVLYVGLYEMMRVFTKFSFFFVNCW
jgi:hypothetical protein